MSFERRFRTLGGAPLAASPSSQIPSFSRDGHPERPESIANGHATPTTRPTAIRNKLISPVFTDVSALASFRY